MRSEQEIRERIKNIEKTNGEDGGILGRELKEHNQKILDTLKWVLGEARGTAKICGKGGERWMM